MGQLGTKTHQPVEPRETRIVTRTASRPENTSYEVEVEVVLVRCGRWIRGEEYLSREPTCKMCQAQQ